MKHRTQAEIDEQIKWLRENRSKIRKVNGFGDDNHAAIAAQIEVLEDGLSEDDVDDNHSSGDWADHEHDNAREVVNWRDYGGDESKPSEAWAALVRP